MDHFLKSKFKIGSKISENPFSLTYSGTTLSGESPVVIKIYKRGTLNSALIKEMKQKVKLLQEKIHPRIVPLLDGDYGWQGFYYVRPFIKGETLAELIKEKRIAQDDAETIIAQVCEALAKAHKIGIIHGALKPGNVIVDRDGVKLTDFVIEGEVKESIPQKAEYILQNEESLSPEELVGGKATALSDVFSAGVLLYKMLTNKNPFSTQLDKIHGRLEIDASIPRYLGEILQKALSPDPLLRFKKISDLAESIKYKSIIESPSNNLDLPQIELENTPHPQEKEYQMVKSERKKSFFLVIVILLSVLAGIIYAVISSIMIRQ